ncbi:MAG: hypothetical protein IJL69_04055 [Oscillospiraceae bacterium]|nr:hypothetical protein [Oscillospiraceae bacterium]
MKNSYPNRYRIGPFEQFTRTVLTVEDGLPSGRITALAFDRDGALCIGTDRGLVRLAGGALTPVDPGGEAAVSALFCAGDGRLFAGAGNRLLTFGGGRPAECRTLPAPVVDVKTSPDGTLWVLTETHLFRKRSDAADFDLKLVSPAGAASLAVDRGDRVFVGTKGAGIHALTGKRWHWSERTAGMTGLLSDCAPCVAFDPTGYLWIGTDQGVCVYDGRNAWLDCRGTACLPRASVTAMAADREGDRWFATTTGLILLHRGALSYYGYRRWLPDPCVTAVAVSDDGRTVAAATPAGLALLSRKTMTLAEKAAWFREEAEAWNVRKDGFCLERHLDRAGVLSPDEGFVAVTDNDGSWTGVYLAGLCYEYAVTGDPKALERARRSLNAMLRLTTITGIEGFTARAIRYRDERHFQEEENGEWHLAENGAVEWRGETSSDEMTGHFFAYSIYYQLCADDAEKAAIRETVRKIMDHILDNDFHLIDTDGRPTTWANWNPDDLNGNDQWIYEKGTNTLELLGFLKVTENMTGDARYGEVFRRLLSEHHYGMNLMQYRIPDGHLLHIDDHLDFLSILTLLTNCDDAAVRSLAMMGLTHHWNDERVERNAMFNVIYGAMTGAPCDVDVIADELVDHPMDLFSWEVYNSHRTDLVWDRRPEELGMPPQLVSPLAPHERRICNEDGNRFICDCGCEELLRQQRGERPAAMLMFPGLGCSRGFTREVGNTFLLPYWMGRYYGILE